MKRTLTVIVLAIIVLVAIVAVRSKPAGVDANADAGTPDGGPMPYLPARSAADDSFAPLSSVEKTLLGLRPGLNFCYRVAARSDPNLIAKAMFRVTIAGDGHPTGVELVSAETEIPPPLVACIKQVLSGAEFKATPDGGTQTVSVPLAFRPPVGGWKDGGP